MANTMHPADTLGCSNTLEHTDATRGLAPIPAPERGLLTATAVPYFKVSDEVIFLEGPAFDREGNLLFLHVDGGRVLRLSPDRQLTTVCTVPDQHPAGIAVHRDGRIFVTCVGSVGPNGQFANGRIFAVDPDGGNFQNIVAPELGYVANDLVFDAEGGLYFTDFRGTATQPLGGLYYLPPDFSSVRVVLPDLCGGNGVALSPDGKVLWATEYHANRLHRMDLAGPGLLGRSASMVPYHFIGRAPDSMRTDSAGHAYVALQRQGRVMAFSPYGMPIGQILMPGREDDHFLQVTNMALQPGSRNIYITSWDLKGRGSWIFVARGLADGLRLFSHQ
jgi:lactonase